MKTSASAAMLGQRSLAPSDSSGSPRRAASTASAASESKSPAPRRAVKKSASPKSKPPLQNPENEESEADETPDDASENGGDDAKKRVRLKPETREQLLERLRNPPLSLHETSILLRVSRATVRRYADAGRLPCLRTPGGQRRFALRDIENFYRLLKTKR